ncbi:MAG: hypothetical protein ACI837_001973 [Crocinitomicaceae bacterium]|jgi:hypothetical protein
MKKYLAALLVLTGILSLQSCNEELTLSNDFVETAVIYGLLDQSDSVHMIKINRAFIGPGNANEIAQIPDSSYFTNVTATIKEYVDGSLLRTWVLSDTMITDKDENGIFYAPEQKLYYFATSPSTPLLGAAIYTLHVDINNGEFEVTSETELVDGISTTASSQNFSFKFASNPGEYKSTSVSVNTGNSYQLNTKLDIGYFDYIAGVNTEKNMSWNLGEAEVNPNSSKVFSANGETFYNLMASACATGDPLVDQRRFGSITITITGGAEALYNYILVNQPSSSLAQSKPTFTNLVATNDHPVVGIFSSRQTLKIVKPFYISPAQAYIRAIDKKSTQELCQGPITGPYLFCSQHPGDNIFGSEEPYACP